MKTFKLKNEIWLWLIMLVPLIVFSVVYSKLPGKIPSHFDVHGRGSNYMTPVSFILVMSGTGLLVYFLTLLLPLIDPKRANYTLFNKAYFIIRLMILLLLSSVTCLMLMMALGKSVNINRIVFLIVMLVFMILGNYLSNVRPNWFVGIRTPWTLSSETVWKKTHQLGGKTFFFAGLCGFILFLFLPMLIMEWVFGILVAGAVLIPVIYSYVLYHEEEKQAQQNKPT